MDRQKKPLHHHETSRECRRDVRGVAGLLRVAAEVLEGYFSSQGFPLRSVVFKFQVGIPRLQHQYMREMQITSCCEKQQGFCLPGRGFWRLREPLTGPMHKISLAATYPGLWQREVKVTRDIWEEPGCWTWHEPEVLGEHNIRPNFIVKNLSVDDRLAGF